jgi:signal transduction histidine kinase
MSHGDSLHKCFENILRNALSHSPENSAIQVSLNTTDHRLEVVIEDQGAGVPEDALSKIFDSFYRVDTARTRESGGYGLGLSIARRAVLQHEGTITAENSHPGLRISVSLPVSES